MEKIQNCYLCVSVTSQPYGLLPLYKYGCQLIKLLLNASGPTKLRILLVTVYTWHGATLWILAHMLHETISNRRQFKSIDDSSLMAWQTNGKLLQKDREKQGAWLTCGPLLWHGSLGESQLPMGCGHGTASVGKAGADCTGDWERRLAAGVVRKFVPPLPEGPIAGSKLGQ